MKNLREKVVNAVIREKFSSRGGGIEIDLGAFTPSWEGEKMSAYQNYLGGGMLGGIGTDSTIKEWKGYHKLTKIAEELIKIYAYNVGIEDEDIKDYNNLPLSAY